MQLTGYELAQVVNTKLEDVGLEPIPSQMVYNYMRSGRIEFVLDENGHKRIELDEAKRFVRDFVAKKRSGSNSRAELLKEFD